MTYTEVTAWLYQQVPNFHQAGAQAYKPGLERMHTLMSALDHPEQSLKIIHVAGTNGKGSVAHILAAIFQYHGYKTGLFTSPHIHDYRERIKINGQYIAEQSVVDFVERHYEVFKATDASFFEITTAMAFHEFKSTKCDIVIIETGLGGRLDATNIITKPLVSIITTIGKDHEQFLGNTLSEIAQEKAGIIKTSTPVVLGQIHTELIPVFSKKANLEHSSLTIAEDHAPIPTDLLGEYQQKNIQTALKALNELKADWQLHEKKIFEALNHVRSLTKFQGRFHQIAQKPLTIADAAHNLIGIQALIQSVSRYPRKTLRIVYGAADDKNYREILQHFPKEAVLYLTEFNAKRSVSIQEWQGAVKGLHLNYYCFDKSADAIQQCQNDASNKDIILICGSFYLLEEVL